MTISTTTSRNSHSGNDITTSFSFPYYFLADGDLTVILVDSAGTETTQTLSTHYTVTGAGNANGGTVEMVTAPATGETLIILRETPITQEVDYITGDAFPAETHELALDKLTMIAQQQDTTLARTLRLSDASGDSVSTVLPAPVAGYLIGWNDSADALASLAQTDTLVVVQATAPDENVFKLWYDTSTSNFKYWDGSAWQSTSGTDITGKADKVVPAADVNIAVLDGVTGNIEDGGTTIAAINASISANTSSIAGKADASHTHAASDIVSGTIDIARLGSGGVGDGSTYLACDNTWQTVSTSPTTTQVGNAYGGLAYFAVGTWAVCSTTTGSVSGGSTISGSFLNFMIYAIGGNWSSYGQGSGTWRNMSGQTIYTSTAALFLRVA